jgi:hypothetical protein
MALTLQYKVSVASENLFCSSQDQAGKTPDLLSVRAWMSAVVAGILHT